METPKKKVDIPETQFSFHENFHAELHHAPGKCFSFEINVSPQKLLMAKYLVEQWLKLHKSQDK